MSAPVYGIKSTLPWNTDVHAPTLILSYILFLMGRYLPQGKNTRRSLRLCCGNATNTTKTHAPENRSNTTITLWYFRAAKLHAQIAISINADGVLQENVPGYGSLCILHAILCSVGKLRSWYERRFLLTLVICGVSQLARNVLTCAAEIVAC